MLRSVPAARGGQVHQKGELSPRGGYEERRPITAPMDLGVSARTSSHPQHGRGSQPHATRRSAPLAVRAGHAIGEVLRSEPEFRAEVVRDASNSTPRFDVTTTRKAQTKWLTRSAVVELVGKRSTPARSVERLSLAQGAKFKNRPQHMFKKNVS